MSVISSSAGPNLPGPRRSYCEFGQGPAMCGRLGTACTGATGNVNHLLFSGSGESPACAFEAHVKGTQTILAPVVTSVGLDIASQDQTDDDGIEYTQGILSAQPMSFKVGRDAFYLRVELTVEDVSGADFLEVGFRLAAAYQAAIASYSDVYTLNVKSGALKSYTIDDAGTPVETDLAVAWADTEKKTLLIKVDTAGVVTAYYSTSAAFDSNHQVAPQTWTLLATPSYTLDAGDTFVPFLFFLQDADIAGKVEMSVWDCGLQ